MTLEAFAEAFATCDGGSAALRRSVALHAADALAALEGGLATREGKAISEFYASSDGSDQARALRAAGAAAVIRFTECDAIHLPSCVTPAAIAVPAASAFAPDARRFSAAVETGMAMGIAVGKASGGASALTRGVWPTLLAAPAIAAAATSVALGFDSGRICNALALALGGVSGRNGQPSGVPSGRWLAIGEATHKGMRAALAAGAGFGGDPGMISAEWIAAQSDAAISLPEALDVIPKFAAGAVGFKSWVAARQGQNAIEAFRKLLGDGVDPRAIERIEVALPPVATGVVSRPLNPQVRLSKIANLGLQLGFAAFEPDRLLDIGREEAPHADSLALAAKVDIHADSALADGAEGTWPAEVTVYAEGRAHRANCERLPGDAGGGDAAAVIDVKIGRFCGEETAARLRGVLAAQQISDADLKWFSGAVDAAFLYRPDTERLRHAS